MPTAPVINLLLGQQRPSVLDAGGGLTMSGLAAKGPSPVNLIGAGSDLTETGVGTHLDTPILGAGADLLSSSGAITHSGPAELLDAGGGLTESGGAAFTEPSNRLDGGADLLAVTGKALLGAPMLLDSGSDTLMVASQQQTTASVLSGGADVSAAGAKAAEDTLVEVAAGADMLESGGPGLVGAAMRLDAGSDLLNAANTQQVTASVLDAGLGLTAAGTKTAENLPPLRLAAGGDTRAHPPCEVVDSAPVPHKATVVGDPTFGPSPFPGFAGAVTFAEDLQGIDGGDSVTGVPAVSGIGAAGAFTLEAKIDIPPRTGDNLNQTIAGRRAQGNTSVGVQPTLSMSGDKLLLVFDNGGTGVGITSVAPCGPGPHDVAADYDGTTVRLYVDGVLDASVAVAQVAAPVPASAHFWIGRDDEQPVLPNGTHGVVGLIDEVRWSNVARYAGASYTPASAPFLPDANTLGLWHLDGELCLTSGSQRGLCQPAAAEQLPPDGVSNLQNLSGSVTDVQDDPFASDGNWILANNTPIAPVLPPLSDTVADFSFPTPASPPSGSQVMIVRARARITSSTAAIDPIVPVLAPPTLTLTVLDGATPIAATSFTVPTSYPDGLLFQIEFDASLLSDASGAGVGLRFDGQQAIDVIDGAVQVIWSAEPGAVRWYEDAPACSVSAELDGGSDLRMVGRVIEAAEQILSGGGDLQLVGAATRSGAGVLSGGADLLETTGGSARANAALLDAGADVLLLEAARSSIGAAVSLGGGADLRLRRIHGTAGTSRLCPPGLGTDRECAPAEHGDSRLCD